MPSAENYALSEDQKSHFLEHGYVKIPGCFTRAAAESFTSKMWTRLGMSSTDMSTWTAERTNMPPHDFTPVSEFAPKAWSAICELVGGEEKISDDIVGRSWSDAFIVNLGKDEFKEEDELNFRELDEWHSDGDHFVHFLDSPEQALLVIPLFSDIEPKGGGTVINEDGIRGIAKHLYNHPEGVSPWMISVNDPISATSETRDFWYGLARNPDKTRDETFVEVTGEVGDVYLLHPFMLHAPSYNLRRTIRVITNPPVFLKEPFCLDREDKKDYSLVESKTLRDLGMPDGLKGWKISGKRSSWTPKRIQRMEEMRKEEVRRLEAEASRLGG